MFEFFLEITSDFGGTEKAFAKRTICLERQILP